MNTDFNSELTALKGLININSVQAAPLPNMPFGEGPAKALDYTLNLLKSFGFTTKNGSNYYGYGEIGEGKLFGILAHLDVVPTDGIWTQKPFGGEIIDGKMFGRGTLDDKGPAIAAIFACAKLLEEGYKPSCRIRFILGCNEETGWECMKKYLENEELPEDGISPDADFPVINCEKSIFQVKLKMKKPATILELHCGTRVNIVPDTAVAKVLPDRMTASLAKSNGMDVTVTDKFGVETPFSNKITGTFNMTSGGSAATSFGSITMDDQTFEEKYAYITITSHGKAAHGAMPQDGVNALTALFGVLGIKDALSNQIYDKMNTYDGSGIDLKLHDEPSGDLTFSLNTAHTNGDDLEIQIDIRFPVTFEKEFVESKIKAAFPKAELTYSFQKPLYVPKDDPLVATLLNAYEKVTGIKAEPIAIGGGTYARALPHGVAFGPAFPGKDNRLHEPDEFVALDDLKATTDIYYEALKALCFKEK